MNNRLWRVNGDFTDGGYLLEIILVVDMSFPFSSGKWENKIQEIMLILSKYYCSY
jgi:hypothetical protein